MEIWPSLVEQWQQQSIIEIFAVVLAVAYVWLASEESVWCWPAGFLSTALYVFVYWEVTLFFQMLLNVYYMAMAIWGFLSWRQSGQQKLYISRMSQYQHIAVIGLGLVLSGLSYVVANLWLDYPLIGLDIAITVFSLLATLLTVKKFLECWFYWSVINLVSIYMLWQSALYFTTLLMLVYLVIALRGAMHWRAILMQEQNKANVAKVELGR